jgi:large repetitive protein
MKLCFFGTIIGFFSPNNLIKCHMTKIVTLAFSLLLSMGSLVAQKIDYDNSSKWFLGFNLGTTWQTTDVANRNNVGYGLTLGRSYNYNYGKRIYFDIRARYLRGFWYGQDYDSTSLNAYNPTNQPGYALQNYKDSLGFSVNNFQADVHRLALELAIHANGVRERTGIDPYIFGGVGFTWSQTYGDLQNQVDLTDSYYNYDPNMVTNKPYINSLVDGMYDSPLDGTSEDTYNVKFMPSLGFGIGYQVGKRVTIGLEHKTTFTLLDNFDGYIDASSKYRDIYHFTSAFINFRFKHGRVDHSENTLGNVDNFNTAGGCLTPTVVYSNPTSNGVISAAANYQLVAEVKNVLGRENIVVKQNGVTNYTFNYNSETDRLEAGVVLVPGMNTFEITATNSCGSDVEIISVNYQDCKTPIVTMVSPTVSGQTVTSAAFNLSAVVQNASNQQITVTQNNVNSTNFTFNTTSGALQGTVNLSPGLNTFVISAQTACGTASQTVTVNYQTCIVPSIAFVSPTTSGTTVSAANFTLSALIQNGANSQVKVTHNTRALTNVNYNAQSGSVQTTVALVLGLNTFVITSTNSCGTATETITVNYQNCIAPVITPIAPVSNGTTVLSPNYVLNAAVLNSNNGQGITVTHNTRAITNFTFNNATNNLQTALTLNPGLNTIVISSTNACGTDTETITINYQACLVPVVTVAAPASNGLTVSSPSFIFSGLIQHATNGQGVSLKLNNSAITNYSFNNATGAIQATVNLLPGLNTFILSSTTSCGTDTETIVVNYQPCVLPTVNITAPVPNGLTVTNANFNLTALLQNTNNGQGITVKLNNNAITNYSFNATTGVLQANVTLAPGLNTFVLTATTSCGTDTKTVTVNYDNCIAPVITIVTPSTTGTTVNNANFNFSAMIQNVGSGQQGVSLSLNGRAITNYSLNNATGSLTSSVVLVPGLNTFILTVNTTCGTDTETITINYSNCTAPVVNFVSPASNGTTVSNSTFVVNATVQNSNNGQGITFNQNGTNVTNYSFNNATGTFQSTVALVPGLNTFLLSSLNACGTDAETVSVTYTPCVAPIVTIVTPTMSNTTVTSANFTLGALILNANNGQGVSLNLNNVAVTNYSFNNTTGALQANLMLNPGVNTIVLTSATTCGTDTETITVNYKNCIAPVITLEMPSMNGSTVTTSTFNVAATIANATNSQGITLTINGRGITNFNFNNTTGAFQSTVNLTPGLNNIVLSVTTPCGTDAVTLTLNYSNCVPPTVSLTNTIASGATVSNAAFTFSALLANMGTGQGITYSFNGNNSVPANFNSTTGVLTSNVTLVTGSNTFVVNATNACGTASQQYNVIYKPCVLPVVAFANPATSGITVNSPSFTLNASVLNVENSSGIVFTQNGNQLTNYTFNSSVGLVGKITLVPGANTFIVTATNDCGTTTQTVVVNYTPCSLPVITLSNPSTNGMVVNSASININANIMNLSSSSSVTVTQNGMPISGFNFNPTSGLAGKAKLNQGLNTFVVTATNECGTVTETFTATYIPCVTPVITFTSPAVNGMTVSNQNFPFSASVVNAGSVMDMKINGRAITTYNFNNSTSLLTANLALIQGTNTIMVTVTNDCGTVTETISVNYVQADSGSGDGQNSGTTGTNSSENAEQNGQTKLTICHTENGVSTTLEIRPSDWPAHMAHGDKLGACPDNKGKLDEKPGVKPTESTPKTPESGRGGL